MYAHTHNNEYLSKYNKHMNDNISESRCYAGHKAEGCDNVRPGRITLYWLIGGLSLTLKLQPNEKS